MSHTLNAIWIHAIWSTKDRKPFLKPSIETSIHNKIREEFEEFDCELLAINGSMDQVHVLFRMNTKKALSDIIKQVKGGTSHRINQQEILPGRFAWQTGYAVFSVSESNCVKVGKYIRNQKEHHAKKSFQDEYRDFVTLIGE